MDIPDTQLYMSPILDEFGILLWEISTKKDDCELRCGNGELAMEKKAHIASL
jgi:hypothetical protein